MDGIELSRLEMKTEQLGEERRRDERRACEASRRTKTAEQASERAREFSRTFAEHVSQRLRAQLRSEPRITFHECQEAQRRMRELKGEEARADATRMAAREEHSQSLQQLETTAARQGRVQEFYERALARLHNRRSNREFEEIQESRIFSEHWRCAAPIAGDKPESCSRAGFEAAGLELALIAKSRLNTTGVGHDASSVIGAATQKAGSGASNSIASSLAKSRSAIESIGPAQQRSRHSAAQTTTLQAIDSTAVNSKSGAIASLDDQAELAGDEDSVNAASPGRGPESEVVPSAAPPVSLPFSTIQRESSDDCANTLNKSERHAGVGWNSALEADASRQRTLTANSWNSELESGVQVRYESSSGNVVDIHLRRAKAAIPCDVTLTAYDQPNAQMLRGSAHELKNSLERKGIKFSRFSVQAGGAL